MIQWNQRRGFALTLIIVAFSLLAVVMLVLTEGANTMIFQADTSYLQAVERNLKASGLAWAKRQTEQGASASSENPVNLDVKSLHFRPATLTIRFEPAAQGPNSVQIETTCQKGRRVLKQSTVESIP